MCVSMMLKLFQFLSQFFLLHANFPLYVDALIRFRHKNHSGWVTLFYHQKKETAGKRPSVSFNISSTLTLILTQILDSFFQPAVTATAPKMKVSPCTVNVNVLWPRFTIVQMLIWFCTQPVAHTQENLFRICLNVSHKRQKLSLCDDQNDKIILKKLRKPWERFLKGDS